MRPLLLLPIVGLVLWALLQGLMVLGSSWTPALASVFVTGTLGLFGYVTLLNLLGAFPPANQHSLIMPSASDPSAGLFVDAAATDDASPAGAVVRRIEQTLPQTKDFYNVRLRPRFWGWVCTVTSRIPSLPWQYQVYTWGQRPDTEKIARLLSGSLQWFAPQAKAHQLAEDILGREGMQRVLAGTFFLPSRLSRSVEYRFTPYSLILYRDGRPLGSFCLQSRGRFPLWDVVLSRVIMVSGSELDFLRTAHFYGPVPPYFAMPMNRDQYADIFGKETLAQWDIYTSSIPGKATRL